MRDRYDVIVMGSGLGGLTAANRLAQSGHRVLLAEQHSQFGGLATYFRRKGHIFDVSLHGFPIGMKKSFRKYWGREFSDRVTQVSSIRFDNPQFALQTTFDTTDFTQILCGHFGLDARTVSAFYGTLRAMNYYDDRTETTAQLFERFFPGRRDVWRLLMEPITYANGSTLDEPAITYGIVFGNFMSRGVYTFQGGTDVLIGMMAARLRRAGVDCESSARVEKVLVTGGAVTGAVVNGREIGARSVVSNGNLIGTVEETVGAEHFGAEFMRGFRREVRLSNSSAQVYIGIKPGEKLDFFGDLLFTSTCPEFSAEAICSRHITSRTFSVYYPSLRPGSGQHTVVASMNANYDDWAGLPDRVYRAEKQRLIEDALHVLERYIPRVRAIVDYTEAATPKTFARYTLHRNGASFGTKFEALQYSMDLPKQVRGLFHTGSAGIIMSGWLGSANYGVIAANEVDKYLEES